jgi:hypothetical protein
MAGEYVHCRGPFVDIDVFGTTVQAWHTVHAQRIAVNKIWESRCECCNHHLRYCFITQDDAGKFHCFGRTCLDINALGEEGARRVAYTERIEQKQSGGFCATFNVPTQFWDMPREKRPQFARPWKGKAFTRRGRMTDRPQWKLSVWGASFEECLDNCMKLDGQLGIKLS